MMPVPEMHDVDVAFSNIKYMPKYEYVPAEFKRDGNPYVDFVSGWFFGGRTKEDIERLIPKDGIDKNKALRAIKAVLGSYEPRHEHKEAACAYMLSEWFTLKDEAQAT